MPRQLPCNVNGADLAEHPNVHDEWWCKGTNDSLQVKCGPLNVLLGKECQGKKYGYCCGLRALSMPF